MTQKTLYSLNLYKNELSEMSDTIIKKAKNMTKEQKFCNILKDIFVGTKVEDESDVLINLMRIKARYYEKGTF